MVQIIKKQINSKSYFGPSVGMAVGLCLGFFLGRRAGDYGNVGMRGSEIPAVPCKISPTDTVEKIQLQVENVSTKNVPSLPTCSRSEKLDSITKVTAKPGEYRVPTKAEAEAFVADDSYLKHLQWNITPEVRLPGVSDVAEFIFNSMDVPGNLEGKTVLDIGTVNGCTAFEMERRGATRVYAMDIFNPEHHGFSKLHSLLNSKVTFLQASLYYLPEFFEDKTFDFIAYSGVIYHLRNPMSSVDALYKVLKDDGILLVETAAANAPTPKPGDEHLQWIGWCKGAKCNKDSTNTFFFTPDSLTSFFEDNGFKLKQIVENSSNRLMAVFVKVPERTIGYGDVNADIVLPVFPCPKDV